MLAKEHYRKSYRDSQTSDRLQLDIHSQETPQLPLTSSAIHYYNPPEEEGKESWLISYIDMLMLLITLFVLLLSYQNSAAMDENVNNEQITTATTNAMPVAVDVASATVDSMLATVDVAPATVETIPTTTVDVVPATVDAMLATADAIPAEVEVTPETADISLAMVNLETTTQSAEWQQLLKTTKANQENIFIEENEEELSVTLNNQLVFQPGEVDIKPHVYSTLNEIVNLLKQYPHPASIAGHTDSTPIKSTLYPSNWELSTARATNITRYLIEHGVPAKQLRAIGYADTRPNASNDTDEGKADNRRVTITLHLVPEKS